MHAAHRRGGPHGGRLRPPPGFSIAELAATPGLDRGLAEDHAGHDAEPLIAAAYERESHAVMDCCEYAFAGAASWWEGLRAGVVDELRMLAERPDALRHPIRGMVVDGELTGPPDELADRVILSVRAFEASAA